MQRMIEEEKRIGHELVIHVQAIARLVQRARELVDERRKTGPADATAIAGHLAGALHAAGGKLPDSNVHRLRWPWEEKRIEDPSGLGAALALVKLVIECLSTRTGSSEALRHAADVWPDHATKADAEKALGAVLATLAPPPPKPAAPKPVQGAREGAMPLVAQKSPPPGSWRDGEYVIEEFVRQPSVG